MKSRARFAGADLSARLSALKSKGLIPFKALVAVKIIIALYQLKNIIGSFR